MKQSLLLLILFCASPAVVFAFDKWDKEDVILLSVSTLLSAADWRQTRVIADSDEYWETNPILGKYPTRQEVDNYFFFAELFKISIAHILPQKHRRYWLMFWIGAEAALVHHNYQMGIRMEF